MKMSSFVTSEWNVTDDWSFDDAGQVACAQAPSARALSARYAHTHSSFLSALLCVCLLGFLGNSVVIVTYALRRNKTTAHYLMQVLAWIDWTACVVIYPYLFYKHGGRFYDTPVLLCRGFEYLVHYMLAVHLGVFTTAAVDRYYVVYRPARFVHSYRRIVAMSASTLLGGLLLCSPLLQFLGHRQVALPTAHACVVRVHVCDVSDRFSGSLWLQIYIWLSFTFMVLSVLFLIVTFCVIRHTVRRKQREVVPGDVANGDEAEKTDRSKSIRRSIIRTSSIQISPTFRKGSVCIPAITLPVIQVPTPPSSPSLPPRTRRQSFLAASHIRSSIESAEGAESGERPLSPVPTAAIGSPPPRSPSLTLNDETALSIDTNGDCVIAITKATDADAPIKPQPGADMLVSTVTQSYESPVSLCNSSNTNTCSQADQSAVITLSGQYGIEKNNPQYGLFSSTDSISSCGESEGDRSRVEGEGLQRLSVRGVVGAGAAAGGGGGESSYRRASDSMFDLRHHSTPYSCCSVRQNSCLHPDAALFSQGLWSRARSSSAPDAHNAVTSSRRRKLRRSGASSSATLTSHGFPMSREPEPEDYTLYNCLNFRAPIADSAPPTPPPAATHFRLSSLPASQQQRRKTVVFEEREYVVTSGNDTSAERKQSEQIRRTLETRGGRNKASVQYADMFLAVICVFLLLWAPYWVINIIQLLNPALSQMELTASPLMTMLYHLFFLENAVNPLIYLVMNPHFVRDVRKAFAQVRKGQVVCCGRMPRAWRRPKQHQRGREES